MADYDIVVALEGDVSNFTQAMVTAKDSLSDFKKSTAGITDKVGSAFEGVGKNLTRWVTTPIAAMGGAAVKHFADFESAMKGVSKTTDLTDAEFNQMSDSILKMTRRMPASAVEIANVAEAAGQLGIEKENILDFSETMIKMGTSTNMSSTEAATSLARLANITGMPQTEFDRLGSTVVALGNNMATTEKEIVDMGLRLASAGKQVGLTEAEILGLSASMSSVGIAAEAGGSSMSRVLQKMNTEVLSGGKHLEGFAKVAGKSAEEFSRQWRENPQQTIVDFIKGLGRVKDSGGDVTQTLKDLGITSTQEIDTLGRLAGAGDMVADAFDLAGTAWEENTALSREAEEAWTSLTNQAKLLWNAIKELGIRMVAEFGEPVKDAIKKATEFIHKLADMDGQTLRTAAKFALFVAAIGPLLVGFGKLIKFVPKVYGAFKTMGVVFQILMGTATGLTGPMLLLSKVIAFMTGPVGLAIAAIVIFIGILVYLWHTNEDVRDALIRIWDHLKELFLKFVDIVGPPLKRIWEDIKVAVEVAWTAITGIIEAALELIAGLLEALVLFLDGDFVGAWNKLKETLGQVWETIVETAQEIWGRLKEYFAQVWEDTKLRFAEAWESIKTYLAEKWEEIKATASEIWESIKTYFAETWENIKLKAQEVWDSIVAYLTEQWNGLIEKVREPFEQIKQTISDAWELVKEITNTVWEIIKTVLAAALLTIVGLVTGDFELIKEAISKAWERIKTITGETWENIKAKLSEVWENLKSNANQTWEQMKSDVSSKFSQIQSDAQSKWESIKQTIDSKIQSAKESVSSKLSEMKNTVSSKFSEMVNTVRSKGSEIANTVRSKFSEAMENARSFISQAPAIGRQLIEGFVQGVVGAAGRLISAVKGAVGDAISAAKNLLGIGSPSKVFRQFGIWTDQGFIIGIDQLRGSVKRTMKGMLASGIAPFQGIKQRFKRFGQEGTKAFANSFNPLSLDPNDPRLTLNRQISDQVNHRVGAITGEITTKQQPAYITLDMGDNTYRAFVEDITQEQGKQAELELDY